MITAMLQNICLRRTLKQHVVCFWSPDVLVGNKVVVHECLVDFGQDVHSLRDLPKHGVNTIQVVQVLSGSDEELGRRQHTHLVCK